MADHRRTHAEIEYWAEEYRRLRVGAGLAITFETFMELSTSTRQGIRAWMHQRLRRWRENPRWMNLAASTYVLDWITDDPRDLHARFENSLADLERDWIRFN